MQSLYGRRNSIYLFQINFQPLHSATDTTRAAVSPATRIQLPRQALWVKSWWHLTRQHLTSPQRASSEWVWVPHHHQKRSWQRHTSVISLHKPQFSAHLYPGGNQCHGAAFCDSAEGWDKHISKFILQENWNDLNIPVILSGCLKQYNYFTCFSTIGISYHSSPSSVVHCCVISPFLVLSIYTHRQIDRAAPCCFITAALH